MILHYFYSPTILLSKESLNLFKKLLADYPLDFEVKLNYAESLLWDKKFDEAKTFYENLIKEKKSNFNALLGYANTLSNLKEYDKALIYVDKALNASSGNTNALISKKYITKTISKCYRMVKYDDC